MGLNRGASGGFCVVAIQPCGRDCQPTWIRRGKPASDTLLLVNEEALLASILSLSTVKRLVRTVLRIVFRLGPSCLVTPSLPTLRSYFAEG
jgi:hypothetical protein